VIVHVCVLRVNFVGQRFVDSFLVEVVYYSNYLLNHILTWSCELCDSSREMVWKEALGRSPQSLQLCCLGSYSR
jgi:hypothetical protein